MDRRNFLKSSAALVAAQGVAMPALAGSKPAGAGSKEEKSTGALIDSAPMLQNYAEDSMGVAFSVTDRANGYVIFGEKPDLSDGRRVYCGGYRVTGMDSDVIQVRLTGLKPATTYYYRIGADRIHYGGGYDMKITGSEEDGRVYSFRTAGAGAGAHFCVINDTHVHWDAFEKLTAKLARLAPSCVVWNGDASNSEETIQAQKRIFLKPEITHKDYAASIPYLLCPGNHDSRGLANRNLERVWMFRQPEERAGRDWDLGRNFAVRMGDIALIGLDTAEDKMDTNPLFANLFVSEPYRKAQVDWLRDALRRTDIASAPYLVAFCHIPLFDPNPRSNPGDVAPADKDPRYSSNFAMWQRTCASLWTPLLQEAGCQLIISAHQHRYRFNEPDSGRTWAQMVGGGPEGTKAAAVDCATIIEGEVKEGVLTVRAYNVVKDEVIDEHTFAPRKVKRTRRKA